METVGQKKTGDGKKVEMQVDNNKHKRHLWSGLSCFSSFEKSQKTNICAIRSLNYLRVLCIVSLNFMLKK